MQKKMLILICLGIFLVGVLFVPVAEADTYNIPNWIKNTAGWWSEDKII